MPEKQKNIISTNRKQLSTKEVKEKQQLGKILHHHRKLTKRPIYKQRKFYFILVLIIITIYLVYLADK